MHQFIGQITGGGEQQQAFGVDVQAPDRLPLLAEVLKSRRPTLIQRPPRMRGKAAKTDGRPSGSSRDTISPSGLWYINTRAGRELPVKRILIRRPPILTLSVGTTD